MQKFIAVSPEVYAKIISLAKADHRTITGQIAFLVEYYLRQEQSAPTPTQPEPEAQS